MKRAGIISTFALAALISCKSVEPAPEKRKDEFPQYVRHENIVQAESLSKEYYNTPERQLQGIYFSEDGKYYYYFENTLWYLGSDDEFRKVDPDHIVAKFAWDGPHVYGVMSGGHHLLYINIAKKIRKAINIEDELRKAGGSRLFVPHIAGTRYGAYVVASNLNSAFFIDPTDDKDAVRVRVIRLNEFLPLLEPRIFLPHIHKLMWSRGAVEIDAYNNRCIIVLEGTRAICRSEFYDKLFMLPELLDSPTPDQE